MSDNNLVMPRPGSDEAMTQGCTCPVMDNQCGRGYRYVEATKVRLYVVNANCPLHGSAAHTTKEERT